MNVKPGDNESVNLLPLGVTLKQSPDMVLFTITDYDLISAGEGIRMTVTHIAPSRALFGASFCRSRF